MRIIQLILLTAYALVIVTITLLAGLLMNIFLGKEKTDMYIKKWKAYLDMRIAEKENKKIV